MQFLRKVVAGPRARHVDDIDLCYVTDFLIATSGPSHTYPQLAYRTPVNHLVSFLDKYHGSDWAIWEFRGEGTGYPDNLVYDRISHFPWPDHHPPPFRLIPEIMSSMHEWLHPDGKNKKKRVIVVHCKAGKGRSGTIACSYLMSEEGWTKEKALQNFTETRMRPGFGAGVSIPSQLRYLDYVERWVENGKTYVEQQAEVLEIHIWGLRDGVSISIEGYAEENGNWKITPSHGFNDKERDDLDEHGKRLRFSKSSSSSRGLSSRSSSRHRPHRRGVRSAEDLQGSPEDNSGDSTADLSPSSYPAQPVESATNVIFRPTKPIKLSTNDINLDVEHRYAAQYGLSMVTAVAHVWFNTWFEGGGPENHTKARQNSTNKEVLGTPWADNSGVFEIGWDAMDGVKGSRNKGTRAFDKVAVVWRV